MRFPDQKIIPLEACRGIAAVIVVLHHFIMAFLPGIDGTTPGLDATHSLAGSVAFVLINGQAAVTFFFVLSGFVLTQRYFLTQDTSLLLTSARKRLVRLAGPVLITTLVSCALFVLHGYYFTEAAGLSGSLWLKSFVFTRFTPGFSPSFVDAALQGALLTFILPGQNTYNPNLWTMNYEFLGSLIVFAMAPVLTLVALQRRTLFLPLCLVVTVIFGWLSGYYVSFLAGMALAWLHGRKMIAPTDAPSLQRILLWLGGVYCLGYILPQNSYALFAAFIPRSYAVAPLPQILLHTIGAAILIYCVLSSRTIYRLLDTAGGALLGRLSFPLYLCHTIVIGSAASWVYLHFAVKTLPATALVAAFVCTLALTLAAAVPLARFDSWWVGRVNRWFKG